MQSRSRYRLIVAVAFAAACTPLREPETGAKHAPPVAAAAGIVDAPTPTPVEMSATPDAETIAYGGWKGFGPSKCAYLAPKSASGERGFVGDDGGVDVVFQFHAGMMADRELRESAVNGVIVSCGYGVGSGPYASAFADPNRFGQMVGQLTRTLEKETGRKGIHLRRLALVSWSAGFAAVGKILRAKRWYDATDTVVLLDSLHAPYAGPGPHTAAEGEDHVAIDRLDVFVRFAEDAARGKKTMVMTHSSIVPPDYASSTEAARALLAAIAVPAEDAADDERTTTSRGMKLMYKAEAGDLHVRGFRGQGARDHFDHLHLIGDALRSWLVPRWKQQDLVYTAAREH